MTSGNLSDEPIVYRDEDVVAFRDAHPKAPVHILLIPVHHVAGLSDTTAEQAPVLGKLLAAAAHVAREQGIERGFRVVINNGREAGQSVFHLHVHLLGGRRLGWPKRFAQKACASRHMRC